MSKIQRVAAALSLVAWLLSGPPAWAGTLRGLLLLADPVNVRVRVVERGGRESSVPCSPATAVTLNGEPFPFELLQAGWLVSIRITDRTGVATSIEAHSR
jgi:hypothetical protein